MRPTGSIGMSLPEAFEYWPDPEQGIREAYRVIKANGIALMIGPWSQRILSFVGSRACGCSFRAKRNTGNGSKPLDFRTFERNTYVP